MPASALSAAAMAAPYVTLDEYLPDIILEYRAQGYLSPLFPLIFIGLPLFWVGALIVRLYEGKERQGFEWPTALRSFRNQMILGFLWSWAPTSGFMVRTPHKTLENFTLREFVLSTLFVSLAIDAQFYWIHRALHDFPSLRWIHAQHHRSLSRSKVWEGLDESYTELATIYGYLTLPWLFVDCPPEFIVMVIGGGGFLTAVMHGTITGGKIFPPWPFVGALYHHGHHTVITKNYGGVFVFWDYFMNTARKPKDAATAKSNME